MSLQKLVKKEEWKSIVGGNYNYLLRNILWNTCNLFILIQTKKGNRSYHLSEKLSQSVKFLIFNFKLTLKLYFMQILG